MFELGFVSAILPDLTLDETAAFANECGYECIEVMCWPTGQGRTALRRHNSYRRRPFQARLTSSR